MRLNLLIMAMMSTNRKSLKSKYDFTRNGVFNSFYEDYLMFNSHHFTPEIQTEAKFEIQSICFETTVG